MSNATIYFNISNEQSDLSEEFRADKPTIRLHEISDPCAIRDPNEAHLNRLNASMGINPGNAGIWLFDKSPDPLNSLKHLSSTLKNILGCNIHKDLPSWYQESAISSSLFYNPRQDSLALFTALALHQKTGHKLKRIIFKMKQLPSFFSYPLTDNSYDPNKISSKTLDELTQLGVQTVIVDNKTVFTGAVAGFELRIITERLNDQDWASYKELVNDISGAGGDNTVSEVLSNPNTWPALMFAQHAFKQNAYCAINNVAKELAAISVGHEGLVEFLDTSKEVGGFADPLDFATEMARIVEKYGEEKIKKSWKELLQYVRKVANLDEYVVPFMTERMFLAKFPQALEERTKIMNGPENVEEKEKKYLQYVQNMSETLKILNPENKIVV